MVKRVCENCAKCSIGYPSFIITCDDDGRVIDDERTETCEHFAELEEQA